MRRSAPPPSDGVDGEADLVFGLPDDLDDDAGRRRWPVTSITSVGECLRDEREGLPRQAQDEGCAVPVLNVGRLGFQDEPAPVRVDHRLPLAALDLLARVV